MDTEKHRLFIGIPLDDSARELLKTRVNDLKQQIPSKQVNWSITENYHLTLLFLGMVEAKKIPEIKLCLAGIKKNCAPFSIEINGLILFPSSEHPKIIAAKVALTEALGKLHAILHQEISQLGIKLDERPYIPHVTLGRICRDPRFRFDIARLITRETSPGFGFATPRLHFELFESLQTAAGTRYQVVFQN